MIAPISRSAVERAIAPFEESVTLPGEAYTSESLFQWEMEHFFEASWVCIGRSSDVLEPGSRRAVRAGGESILLVRDAEGVLHGFFNVCRHRGHELLSVGGSATDPVVQCSYHGWTYRLDGTLKSAPRLGPRPGFDPKEHGLGPVAIAEWQGFVMANVSGSAPTVRRTIGNLEEHVAPYGADQLVAAARSGYDVEANWKLIVENYHECYHCPQIHPQLCEVSPPTSGVNYEPTGLWVGGSMDLMAHAETMSMSGASQAPPLPGLGEEQRRHVYYFGLFPNLLLSLHPDYVMTHRLDPLTPTRTRVQCEWLFPPEVAQRSGFDAGYATEFWDMTNRQDWLACESVQRGVGSRAYRQGPISRPEECVYQFVAMVAGGYLEGRVVPPPAPLPS